MVIPKYLYHGTFSSLLPSILKNGLLAVPKDWRVWANTSSENAVYMSSKAQAAYGWAESGFYHKMGRGPIDTDLTVVKIATSWLDLELLKQSGVRSRPSEYIYYGDIPPEAITVI